jgi:AraC-like DNA-binding protein
MCACSSPHGTSRSPTHLWVGLTRAGFLLARRLAARLHEQDALFVEETAAELIERAIRGPAASSGRRAATRRDRMELVEACKDLLLTRLGEPLSLRALAGELHVSPFHLTRVFRELTGRTLTAYLHDLRLRAAVDRLGEESLSRLAADLGYCSPSHFSDRFRGAFGMAPSQLRNLMEAEARGSS